MSKIVFSINSLLIFWVSLILLAPHYNNIFWYNFIFVLCFNIFFSFNLWICLNAGWLIIITWGNVNEVICLLESKSFSLSICPHRHSHRRCLYLIHHPPMLSVSIWLHQGKTQNNGRIPHHVLNCAWTPPGSSCVPPPCWLRWSCWRTCPWRSARATGLPSFLAFFAYLGITSYYCNLCCCCFRYHNHHHLLPLH